MNVHPTVSLVGRILLALMFVLAGFSKFGDLGGTAGYIASKGLPMASVLAFLTAVIEVVVELFTTLIAGACEIGMFSVSSSGPVWFESTMTVFDRLPPASISAWVTVWSQL